MENIILLTDSYKASHYKQYPPGTKKIYSYFEARSKEHAKETVFFGLQYLLKKYLEGVRVSKKDVDEAEDIWTAHLGPGVFNRDNWDYIVDAHNGRLPISIKAVAEGTPVAISNVLMTVENTDEKCFWLTNFLETLLVQVWYPTSVATLSREIKKDIASFLAQTGDPNLIDFKLHDFGFRGVSSVESAGLGGCAHLINFKGTDTMAGIITARQYYDADMPGFSIPASEHSTITSWGKDRELDAYENMLNQYPEGLVACVSDSYNIYYACENLWGDKLKDKILNRNGTLVIRPDSGNPVEVISDLLEILDRKFGCSTNDKGFKVLPPQVRLIQGDGVDRSSINDILNAMMSKGFSADNIAFGMGGALLQKLNRDTFSFAFKCSQIQIDEHQISVSKQPLGDKGKHSKGGRLSLLKHPNGFQTWQQHMVRPDEDLLIEVFRDGEILVEHTFDEVRERAKI